MSFEQTLSTAAVDGPPGMRRRPVFFFKHATICSYVTLAELVS